jgi:hypothetical protein
MPKWVFGFPLTRPFVSVPHWLPWQVGGVVLDLAARIAFGTPMAYGLPKPDHWWARSRVEVAPRKTGAACACSGRLRVVESLWCAPAR